MNLARMQRLLAVLTGPIRRPYDGPNKRKKYEAVTLDMGKWSNQCRTAGCACGLYVFNHPDDLLQLKTNEEGTMCLAYEDPDTGEEFDDFRAAEMFFGLDFMTAVSVRSERSYRVDLGSALFQRDSYRTSDALTGSRIRAKEIADRVSVIIELCGDNKWLYGSPVLLLLARSDGIVVAEPNTERRTLTHFIGA